MSKWEDSFRKTSGENNGCHCSDNQGLFVPNRQLSAMVAIMLFLAFSIFMTGYFLGKKKAVEQFTEKMHEEAFSDQVYTTVLSVAQEQQPATNTLVVANMDDSSVLSQSINQDIQVSHEALAKMDAPVENELEDRQAVVADDTRYYAQLIGFGTEKAAQLFVKKLATKGIETEVKKRISKTVKGRTSYWYQVITTVYSNKNDLSAVVDRLAKEENIKDSCIRSC